MTILVTPALLSVTPDVIGRLLLPRGLPVEPAMRVFVTRALLSVTPDLIGRLLLPGGLPVGAGNDVRSGPAMTVFVTRS